MVAHRRPDRRERLLQQIRHGQHGGPGIEDVAGRLPRARPAARHGLALDDGDLASGTGEVQGARQPGEPGSDHDDPVGTAGHSAHWTNASDRGPLVPDQRVGRRTTLTKNSSIARTTAMKRSKSTGFVTYALACNW